MRRSQKKRSLCSKKFQIYVNISCEKDALQMLSKLQRAFPEEYGHVFTILNTAEEHKNNAQTQLDTAKRTHVKVTTSQVELLFYFNIRQQFKQNEMKIYEFENTSSFIGTRQQIRSSLVVQFTSRQNPR